MSPYTRSAGSPMCWSPPILTVSPSVTGWSFIAPVSKLYNCAVAVGVGPWTMKSVATSGILDPRRQRTVSRRGLSVQHFLSGRRSVVRIELQQREVYNPLGGLVGLPERLLLLHLDDAHHVRVVPGVRVRNRKASPAPEPELVDEVVGILQIICQSREAIGRRAYLQHEQPIDFRVERYAQAEPPQLRSLCRVVGVKPDAQRDAFGDVLQRKVHLAPGAYVYGVIVEVLIGPDAVLDVLHPVVAMTGQQVVGDDAHREPDLVLIGEPQVNVGDVYVPVELVPTGGVVDLAVAIQR